jgi:hypothetical protein
MCVFLSVILYKNFGYTKNENSTIPSSELGLITS